MRTIEDPLETELFTSDVLPELCVKPNLAEGTIKGDPMFLLLNQILSVPTALQLSAQAYAMCDYINRWFLDTDRVTFFAKDLNLDEEGYRSYYSENMPVVGVLPDFADGIRAAYYRRNQTRGNPEVYKVLKALATTNNLNLMTTRVNAFLPPKPSGKALATMENSGSPASITFRFVLRSVEGYIFSSEEPREKLFQNMAADLIREPFRQYQEIPEMGINPSLLSEYCKASCACVYKDLAEYLTIAQKDFSPLGPWLASVAENLAGTASGAQDLDSAASAA